MDLFNNREIATAIWFLVFLLWVLRRPNVRRSLVKVFCAFCHLKVLASFALMLLYVTGAVRLLAAVGLWKIDLLKDTVLWCCFSAIGMVMRFATSDDAEDIFRKILADSIKIVILLEFLVNTYTFSLPAELIILPVLTLIAMVDVVASSDKTYSGVEKLTKATQTIVGFAILVIVLVRAVHDLQSLNSLDTLRSITLAPLLSLVLCPFVYVMVLISKYELVFLRLDFGVEKGRELKRYARRRILMHAGLNMRRLQHLLRDHAVDLMHIKTEGDVDRLARPRAGS